ncbi:hypothetical protein [Streptomyces sp. Wb2n-11]|uniref:hypothetical protein n=1 Tax=Streptomyces sp. Wb2n-11 TaxID=1030533 RepID=UPI000A971679|nr:hypothetical protein [Streptomyces sp. Wb2n-11]
MSQLLETAPTAHALPPLARRSTTAPARALADEDWPLSRAERSRRLRALRLSILRSLTAGVTGRPKVALYVLVRDGGDPGERRVVALAHAERAGFEVTETFVDDAWKSDPEGRPVLARAYAALRRSGFHGLVAASQVDISSCSSVYEQELHRLHAAGGFLHLALDETQL